MFKKRHSQPQISPLPSPAATNPHSAHPQQPPPGQQFQRVMSGQQQQQQQQQPQPQPYRQGSYSEQQQRYQNDQAQGSMRSQRALSVQGPGRPDDFLAGPQYNGLEHGAPVERVISESQRSKSSDKGEKRRSGLFGFGRKKDKDKEKEKEREERERREREEMRPARHSFNVNRAETHINPNQTQFQAQHLAGPDGQGQYPQQLHRFPTPQGGETPPLPQGQQQQQNRMVSNPSPRPPGQGQGADFGPEPGDRLPKSQTMGFNQPSRPQGSSFVRGDQRDRSDNEQMHGQGRPQGLPKSVSMPQTALDKATPPTPPRDHQPLQANGSPKPQNGVPANRDRAVSASSIASGNTNLRPSAGPAAAPGQPEWMREFQAVVELIAMQPQKTYVASPPELEMIMARTSAGGQPKQGQPGSASNDWDAVWLQLSGISLSMWSMKETRAAAAKGEKVPPTYFNVTDSSLELLAPLPPPPHRPNSHPHHFVFSLNTAGSNRLLFSCPTEPDIARWATGLRLAAWERARLEEIYTGHLIKSGGQEPRMDLQKGRMEGWVRVRIMGGTEWKRLWAVLSTPNPPPEPEDDKKSKRKSFFGMGSVKEEETVIQEPNTGVPMASFYAEPRTPKNRTMAPVLTISSVTQAYAVFPERLEVISQSNLMKVVGRIGGELVAIEGRLRDSGWALVMPETPEAGTASPPVATPLVNMMKWVTAVHDVFGLYGRPGRYNWDERDPKSLFFAYPRGSERNRLFLELDDALVADHRVGSLPQIRSRLVAILRKKREQTARLSRSPPRQQDQLYNENSQTAPPRQEQDYRLPPLSFDQNGASTSPHLSEHSAPRSLSPITERSDMASRNNSQRTTHTERQFSGGSSRQQAQQPSGGSGSSKLQQAHEQSQLETINDADTFGATLADEPHSKSPSGIASPDGSSYATSAMPLTQSPEEKEKSGMRRTQTGDSIYSQSTGVTPTPHRSQAASPIKQGASSSTVAPVPSIVPTTNTKPATAQSNLVPVPATSQSGTGMFSPILAAPLSTTTASSATPRSTEQDSPHSIHSPTPRRVASTEFKADKLMVHEEPAAQYLMNVVEEPRSVLEPPRPADQEKVRPTIITNFAASPAQPASLLPVPASAAGVAGKQNESLGRKPSGARAPPPKKAGSFPRLGSVDDASPVISAPQPSGAGHAQERSNITMTDISEDAKAYLAYADQPLSATQPPLPAGKPVEEEARGSSFAPSKASADRRAKAEAAAAESQRAMNVPGAGKRAAGGKQTWSDEDDDEDEDDVADSPVVSTARTMPPPGSGTAAVVSGPPTGEDYSSPIPTGRGGLRALPPVPQADRRSPQLALDQAQNGYDLPQPTFPDRPRSRSPAQYQQQQASRGPQSQMPQLLANQPPPAAKQNIWNANFAAEHGMPEPPKSGKFVELEEPQAKLTQAFAPHGLLQAGMQDKEDRSAKKQEELARELGSSLINVPSKPPPPSAGLLGAVTQHEKERKNAGGIGATLTDREREKRIAEARQREIEKLQQQQAEHMRQFGDFGQGGQQGYGGYGMGMPMGMGMPPMGFNPYQGGFNPYAQQQAMFAAQMAYQNAMMMSAAGSQAGENGAASPGRPASPTGVSQYGYGAGGGGMPGHQSPFPGQLPYGWPGAMPWMSPAGPGSPGMPGMMGMPSFPSMPSFGPHTGGMMPGGDYLHPAGFGQQQQRPGSGQGTPFDQRSRVDSFHAGGNDDSRSRSEDRQGGAPAT